MLKLYLKITHWRNSDEALTPLWNSDLLLKRLRRTLSRKRSQQGYKISSHKLSWKAVPFVLTNFVWSVPSNTLTYSWHMSTMEQESLIRCISGRIRRRFKSFLFCILAPKFAGRALSREIQSPSPWPSPWKSFAEKFYPWKDSKFKWAVRNLQVLLGATKRPTLPTPSI